MALLVVQDVYNYKYIVDVNKYRTYRETDNAYYLYIENKTIRVTKKELMNVLGHRLSNMYKKDRIKCG